MVNGMTMTSLSHYNDYKTGEIQMHEMYKLKDELYDVPTYCMKFLKYDPFWHQIESIIHIQ
jgi:hypothetical protein